MTFSEDDEPSMVVLNQDGNHGLHGMASTIALSDLVLIQDLARVRALFKDPSPRSIEFESRFAENASSPSSIEFERRFVEVASSPSSITLESSFVGSERAITYEVAVSPLVESGSSHERVCVFRDVSVRVQREEERREEERRAALLLVRAEESNATKALARAEERLSENVKTSVQRQNFGIQP